MAVEQNIEFFCGEDIVIDDTLTLAGAAADLAGMAFTFIVTNAAGTTILQYTVGAGIIISTSPIARITIPRAVTKSLTPAEYNYELCRTDSGENVVCTIGKLTLKQRYYPSGA